MEIFAGEARVAMTPDSAFQLIKLGHSCLVQSGAGLAAGFSDASYSAVGVAVVKTAAALFKAADVVVKVRALEPAEIKRLRADQTVISFFLACSKSRAFAKILRRKRKCYRDGYGAPYQPRAKNGCLIFDGQYRGLSFGH